MQPLQFSKFRAVLKRTLENKLPLSQRICAILVTLYFSVVAGITERRIVPESPVL